MKNAVLCFCFLLFFPMVSYGWQTAVTHISFNDTQRQRQLDSLIYYPTAKQGTTTLLADNAVFNSISVLPDAPLPQANFH